MAGLDFNDRETLKAWLESQPRDVAMAIVARAALRTLPMLYFEVDRSHRHAAAIRSARIFPAFYAFAVPFVAAAYGPFGEEYRDSVADAGEQVSNACGAISGTSENAGRTTGCDETYGILASVCYKAVGLAVEFSYRNATPEFFAGAAHAALRASEAPIAVGNRLQEVGGDLHGALDALNRDINLAASNKLTGAKLAICPLWHGEAADWAAQSWKLLQDNLMDADEGWDVWVCWYDARLTGGRTYPDISDQDNRSIEKARILEFRGNMGAAVGNAKIWEIEARFLIEDTKFAPQPVETNNNSEIDSGVFDQRPAAHRFFANADGKIDAIWQVGDTLDEDVATEIHKELKDKVEALANRLKYTNAPDRLGETLARLKQTLGKDLSGVRLGGLLMSLKSVQADASAYDTPEARKEVLPDIIAQVHDVAGSLDGFVALYPLARKIQAASIALEIQRQNIPKIRQELAEIRDISITSDAVAPASKTALGYAEAEIERESEIAATTSDDQIRAGAIERMADLVALQAVDFRNFAAAVVKPIAGAGRIAKREAKDIGRKSWTEAKTGFVRGVGKSAEAIPRVVVSGLAAMLAGPLAGLAVLAATFAPLARETKKIKEQQLSKENQDDEDETPTDQ